MYSGTPLAGRAGTQLVLGNQAIDKGRQKPQLRVGKSALRWLGRAGLGRRRQRRHWNNRRARNYGASGKAAGFVFWHG